MKIVIDEKMCQKHKMSLEEVLVTLMYRQVEKPAEITDHLVEKEVLVDRENRYWVTQHWSEVIDEILADSQGSERTDDELIELAKKLRDIYPEGRIIDKRTGRPTSYYFRSNTGEVAKKLKTFFARYGSFPDDDIIDATKRYIASYNKDYQQPGFRLLKYFIFKDDIRQGPDGNYVEPLSPLLDFLENKGEKDVINSDDWLNNSRN